MTISKEWVEAHGYRGVCDDEYAADIQFKILKATGEEGWYPANDMTAKPYLHTDGTIVIDVYNFRARKDPTRTFNLATWKWVEKE